MTYRSAVVRRGVTLFILLLPAFLYWMGYEGFRKTAIGYLALITVYNFLQREYE